jgi:hypothetical protein
VLAALADNHTDLAVIGQPPGGVDLVAHDFMDNPLVVIASPDHPLAGRETIPTQALDGQTLVVRERGSGTRSAMDRFLGEQGVGYRAGCELSTNEAIKQAVQEGLGLAIAPLQTLDLELETGRLVVLPVEGFPLIRHWYVAHRGDKRLSVASQAFRDLLLSRPAEGPPAARVKSRAALVVDGGDGRSSFLSRKSVKRHLARREVPSKALAGAQGRGALYVGGMGWIEGRRSKRCWRPSSRASKQTLGGPPRAGRWRRWPKPPWRCPP